MALQSHFLKARIAHNIHPIRKTLHDSALKNRQEKQEIPLPTSRFGSFLAVVRGRIELSLGLITFLLVVVPIYAYASGLFGFVGTFFSGAASPQTAIANSQNIALLQSTDSPAGNTNNSDSDNNIVGGTSLSAQSIVSSASSTPSSDQISLYVVHQGDTLSEIAQMFGVSVNTIVWANDIKGGKVSPGDELVILPISGVQYTVKSGDTLKSIAKKYAGDAGEIAQFNNLASDAKLTAGESIIIPDGEISGTSNTTSGTGNETVSSSISTANTSVSNAQIENPSSSGLYPDNGNSIITLPKPAGASEYYSPAVGTHGPSTPVIIGYYERPILGGIKTQGLHGHNAVDLAAPYGTNIMAAADGTVIVAKTGGWNGGYGSYVVISHANGTQTLYAHMSEVDATVGENVTQGESIGKVGMTGDATGDHVHFEIRGALNPF